MIAEVYKVFVNCDPVALPVYVEVATEITCPVDGKSGALT